MRDELDRFYTKPRSAAACVALVDTTTYDLVVEPSAGAGSFSNLFEKCLAYDLVPAAPGVTEADWLTVTRGDLPEAERVLVIGNPPFGTRSTLAKKFLSHAAALGATTIAFILPDTFSKRLNQNCVPAEYRLVLTHKLDDSHFVMPDNTEIFIPCSFFVWTCDPDIETGVDLRDIKPEQPSDYTFLQRGDGRAHFTINGNSGKVRNLAEVSNQKAEHYIAVTDETRVAEVKATFTALDHTFLSSVNGGVAWVNRDDINRAYTAATRHNTPV